MARTYLFNGISWKNLQQMTSEAIIKSKSGNFVYGFEGEPLECFCFDSELGKQYTGAQALAMFIDDMKNGNIDDNR